MKIPFFTEIERSQTVLLAGAGGGFDIFCGLPLYFFLRKAGKTVHLANLSFTELGFCEGDSPMHSLLKVTAESSGPANYFPELHLARWLSDHIAPTPIYAISRTGALPITDAYRWLINELKPDTLILIDGGMDSLMRGDEIGLGTPQEDSASLAAASAVNVAQKYLVSVGFGVDTFHGVCHAHFLENVAALIGEGAYLGAWSLTKEMEEFDLYQQACEFVHSRMPRSPSIVNTSIISAVLGRFGDFHTSKRTEGSTLFINPLMSIYWAFQLEPIARRNLYLDSIRNTATYQELTLAIEKFTATHPKRRPWMEIPC
ncbi:MAG TPA: DUF1152 domain-containing protein [Verrucomicrobiae bacterium]